MLSIPGSSARVCKHVPWYHVSTINKHPFWYDLCDYLVRCVRPVICTIQLISFRACMIYAYALTYRSARSTPYIGKADHDLEGYAAAPDGKIGARNFDCKCKCSQRCAVQHCTAVHRVHTCTCIRTDVQTQTQHRLAQAAGSRQQATGR